jgi:oligopeptidase B
MNRPTLLRTAFLGALLSATSIAHAAPPEPPVAAKKPHDVRAPHGEVRQDEYYWLRDDSREDPEMLAYIKAENDYADAVLAPTKALQDTLYKEIVGRIKQDDSSVPYRLRGYHYYSRFEEGQNYPVIARRKGSMDAPEEVLLDQNAMAEGHGFFQVSDWVVSPDNKLLAWAEDMVGRRQYVLKVKNLETGEILSDTVTNIEPNVVWADDNRTLFYIDKDPTTLLGKRVKTHVLGTPASADGLVYEEADDSFYMGIGRTRDDDFVCIYVQSTVSSEQRCTSAETPGAFAVLASRQRDFEYQADHLGGRWVVRTNWDAPNYRLMTLADGQSLGNRALWKDMVPHSAADGRRQERIRRFGRAGLCHVARQECRARHRVAAL